MRQLGFLIGLLLPTIGFSSTFQDYPLGHISLDQVYEAVSEKKGALRKCHQTYLQKIPGAFDPLSLEFQIDPHGKVIPFSKALGSSPKDVGLSCIKSILRSIQFPKPEYGIVFLRFQSDVDLYNSFDIEKEPLSRNALSIVPYVPQKLIRSMLEMYMPYYNACFQNVTKRFRPMTVALTYTIYENGLVGNIVTDISPQNAQVATCMEKVTKEHRYPTGYAETVVRRNFSAK